MARWSRSAVQRKALAAMALVAVAGGLAVVSGAAPAGASGQAPTAVADSYHAASAHVLTVAAPGVLANDTDTEGDVLTASIVTGASNGQLSLQPNGSFTYRADNDFVGTDTFAYRANDGTDLSDTVLVSIVVKSPTQAFVSAVYQDFLSRSPDAAGLSYWSGRIESHKYSREYVAFAMSRSHEYGVKVVNRMYLDVLDRSVDPSGREYWAGLIQKGMSPATLLQQLLGSNEFFRKWGTTNEGFVDQLYAGLLDRAPTALERADAVGRLETGIKRQVVASDLYRSLDSRVRRVHVQYLDLLDRAPTDPELFSGVVFLQQLSDVQLAVSIAASGEYLEASYLR